MKGRGKLASAYVVRVSCAVLALASNLAVIRTFGHEAAGRYFVLFATGYFVAQLCKAGNDIAFLTGTRRPTLAICSLSALVAYLLGAGIESIGTVFGMFDAVATPLSIVGSTGAAIVWCELIGEGAKGDGKPLVGIFLANGLCYMLFCAAQMIVEASSFSHLASAWNVSVLIAAVASLVYAIAATSGGFLKGGMSGWSKAGVSLGIAGSFPFAAQALIISVIGTHLGYAASANFRIMTRAVAFIGFFGNAMQAAFAHRVASMAGVRELAFGKALGVSACLGLALCTAYVLAEERALGMSSGAAWSVGFIAAGQAMLTATSLAQARLAHLSRGASLISIKVCGYAVAIAGVAIAGALASFTAACAAYGAGLLVQGLLFLKVTQRNGQLHAV